MPGVLIRPEEAPAEAFFFRSVFYFSNSTRLLLQLNQIHHKTRARSFAYGPFIVNHDAELKAQAAKVDIPVFDQESQTDVILPMSS